MMFTANGIRGKEIHPMVIGGAVVCNAGQKIDYGCVKVSCASDGMRSKALWTCVIALTMNEEPLRFLDQLISLLK